MLQMGAGYINELKFTGFKVIEERRDPWIDLNVSLGLPDGTELPEGAEEISGLVICNKDRYVVQTLLLVDGCDSEYQFTPQEKEQILDFLLGQNLAAGTVEEEKQER